MIRVLCVDRVRLVCDVLAAALADELDIRVVGVATNVEEALEKAAQTQCDVILVNTSLPDNGALALVESARGLEAGVKTLVMGVAETEPVILRYLETGASGYVLNTDSVAELVHNIRAVAEERALVSADIAAALINRIADLSQKLEELGADPSVYAELTEREKEVLGLVADGMTNQEIAEVLTIEVGTVKNHVHSILRKLNVNSRLDAASVLAYVEDELLTPDS